LFIIVAESTEIFRPISQFGCAQACSGVTVGNNYSISFSGDDRAHCDRIFAALAEGGTVLMPLQETFWGAYFGTLADKFGIQWMVDCALQEG